MKSTSQTAQNYGACTENQPKTQHTTPTKPNQKNPQNNPKNNPNSKNNQKTPSVNNPIISTQVPRSCKNNDHLKQKLTRFNRLNRKTVLKPLNFIRNINATPHTTEKNHRTRISSRPDTIQPRCSPRSSPRQSPQPRQNSTRLWAQTAPYAYTGHSTTPS